MKSLARSYVRWPKMDKAMKNFYEVAAYVSQESCPSPATEPLHP